MASLIRDGSSSGLWTSGYDIHHVGASNYYVGITNTAYYDELLETHVKIDRQGAATFTTFEGGNPATANTMFMSASRFADYRARIARGEIRPGRSPRKEEQEPNLLLLLCQS